MAYHCDRCGGEVELARTPLESGLVRLAALGADDFELEFDDPAVHAAAAAALGPCPHGPDPSWQAAELAPLADAGWQALVAAGERRSGDARAGVAPARARARRARERALARRCRARTSRAARGAGDGPDAGGARRRRRRRGGAAARARDRAGHGPRGQARRGVAGVIDALVARVGGFVARERLLTPGQQVLALASGGADSTLLVHALVRLGYDVSVLHVAHALRGVESECGRGVRRGPCGRARPALPVRGCSARRRSRPRAPGARPPARRGRLGRQAGA